jgi:hypothetical protein
VIGGAGVALEFHLHHYAIGLVLCVCGQGNRRFSTVIQAIGLALFVEGLAMWGLDPMFDEITQPAPTGYAYGPLNVSSSSSFGNPIISRVDSDIDNGAVVVEWMFPVDVIALNCTNQTLRLIPGISSTPAPLAPVFVLTRNGIQFPEYYRDMHAIVNATSNMALQIRHAGGRVSPRFPVGVAYYEQNATTCERLFGIYSILQNSTAKWWYRG